MRAFFCVGLATVFFVVWTLSPYQANVSQMKNIWNIMFFYASLMVMMTGFFSLVLFWVKRKTHDENLQAVHQGISLRQGVLLSFIVIILLVLQSFRVLVWWDALLAVGAVMMVELYFLAR